MQILNKILLAKLSKKIDQFVKRFESQRYTKKCSYEESLIQTFQAYDYDKT